LEQVVQGAVYLAYDQVLNRHVAIKCVHTHDQALTDASGAFNEAKRLASLQHPNIVSIFDFLTEGKNVFVVMEFINGESLDRLQQPMEEDVFLDFAGQCLEALVAAHSLGMAHRDIKSANIMITSNGTGGIRVKLLDFGLAKVMTAPLEQTLDHSGALTGSIYFLSPEQLSRRPIDHRADLYSLGCVFYRALTLQNPFQRGGLPEIIAAHLQHDFTPLAQYRPDLPQGLTAWVEALFSFDPNERPASAAAALKDLEQVKAWRPAITQPAFPAHQIQSSPPAAKARRRFPILLAAVLAVLGLAGVFGALVLFGGHEKMKSPEQSELEEKRDNFTIQRTGRHRASRGKNGDCDWRNLGVSGGGRAAFVDFQEPGIRQRGAEFCELREGRLLHGAAEDLRRNERQSHRHREHSWKKIAF
jgi:serine/threonine protein kinase